MSGQITELQAETQALAGLKDQVQETQDQVAGPGNNQSARFRRFWESLPARSAR